MAVTATIFVVAYKGKVMRKVFDHEADAVAWADANPDIVGSFKVDKFTHDKLSQDALRAAVMKQLRITN